MRDDIESGQTTVVMALFLGTFLFAFVALGVDLEYMFRAKRMAQAAADAAALAAAEEAGNGSSAQQTAAEAIARLNGFDTKAASNPATVKLNSPPTLGSYSNSSSYIEAIVTRPVPTFFMGAVNHTATVTVGARAVAASGMTSPTCVCLQGSTGQDLYLDNNSQLTATGCGIMVNSSSSNAVGITNNSTLSAQSLGTVSSTWNNSANISNSGSLGTTKVVQGLTSTCQPSMPAAPTYSAAQCTSDPLSKYPNGGSSYSIGPGAANSTTQSGNLVCYNSLDIGKNNNSVTLNSGIYVINGGALHFYSSNGGYSNYGGNGVFFYLTNGATLTIDRGANVNLTAMTSGTYSGILLQQDSADTNTLTIQEGSDAIFNGAIYAPNASIAVQSGSGGTVNGPVVAQSLSVQQGGYLISTPISNLGTMNLSVAKLTE